jgi:hypothetical protein
MDGGPFRTGQTADRRATPASRPQPVARDPEADAEPKPVHRAAPTHRSRVVEEEKTAKKRWMPILGILVAIALIVGGWYAWSKMQAVSSTGIDSSKYQAVFFTNGQVYFGKLQNLDQQYLKLTDIYYVQTNTASSKDSENPQASASNQADVQLIKLGEELHGPEDAMVINRDQVMFFENLKSDGKVAQTIDKAKK